MLNLEKCDLFWQEIRYLGHMVNKGGIWPDLEKVAKEGVPYFDNLTMLWAFVGLAFYCYQFILYIVTIANLLHHLISVPVLRYPDFDQPFYLHTDASGVGLGAVLYRKTI